MEPSAPKERSMPTARLLRARSANLHQVPLMDLSSGKNCGNVGWFTMILWNAHILKWWTDISTSKKRELFDVDVYVLRSRWRTSDDWSGPTSAYSWGGRVDEINGCFMTFDVSITIQWHQFAKSGTLLLSVPAIAAFFFFVQMVLYLDVQHWLGFRMIQGDDSGWDDGMMMEWSTWIWCDVLRGILGVAPLTVTVANEVFFFFGGDLLLKMSWS